MDVVSQKTLNGRSRTSTVKNETEWDSLDWLKSAKRLIEWVVALSPSTNVLLMIRHSHREVINNHAAQLSTGLTPTGCRMSTEFGSKLPTNRKTRIFFSFVSRCYQTADEIVKGFSSRGGSVEEFETLSILATPEIRDQSVWHELQPDGMNIDVFINRWADGEFDDKIERFQDYESRLKAELFDRLAADDAGSMHIHVTHDLALMAAKRMFLQREIGAQDREPFLGGIGIRLSDGEARIFLGGEEMEFAHHGLSTNKSYRRNNQGI